MEKLIEKYKSYGTKVLQKLATARKTKAPKEPKEPRPLKKEISDEEAKANLENAKVNTGRYCKFICTKTKEQTEGIIVGVRLDHRNNFIQYRIRVNDGHVWGKAIDSKDLEIGEMAPEAARPKRGRKKAAPKVEQNKPENAPAEE